MKRYKTPMVTVISIEQMAILAGSLEVSDTPTNEMLSRRKQHNNFYYNDEDEEETLQNIINKLDK